jgi:hypothetical protein
MAKVLQHVHILAARPNYCSMLVPLLHIPTITACSNHCSIAILVLHGNTFAAYSRYCSISRLLQHGKTILAWQYYCCSMAKVSGVWWAPCQINKVVVIRSKEKKNLKWIYWICTYYITCYTSAPSLKSGITRWRLSNHLQVTLCVLQEMCHTWCNIKVCENIRWWMHNSWKMNEWWIDDLWSMDEWMNG